MAKLIALLFLAVVIAVASSQYLAGYRGVGYAGAPLLRGAYAPGLGYAGAYPGYAGAYPGYAGLGYGAYGARGVVLG